MDNNPLVTVVILTMGDAPNVMECLKNQIYQNFEVIFAREKGIVGAMNKALEKAKGEIFVRIDDDVWMGPDWLLELVCFFGIPFVAGCTGPTFVPKDRRQNRDSIRFAERPHWFLKWLYDGGKFNPGGIRKCGCVSYDSNFEERFENQFLFPFEPDYLEGTNWAMRTDLIRKVGGFDPAFDGVAEWFDTDVERKVKKLGYKLVYSYRAHLSHQLEIGEHYSERFEGFGRIKNFLRFHWRHSKFHPKMIVFLILWIGYFISLNFRRKND